MEKASRILLLFVGMFVFGVIFLILSKTTQSPFSAYALFVLGVYMVVIGFHELCHVIASMFRRYRVKKAFLNISAIGIEVEPNLRNHSDALIVYMSSLLGIPVSFLVAFLVFNSYNSSYAFSIVAFISSIPDIADFVKWRKTKDV